MYLFRYSNHRACLRLGGGKVGFQPWRLVWTWARAINFSSNDLVLEFRGRNKLLHGVLSMRFDPRAGNGTPNGIEARLRCLRGVQPAPRLVSLLPCVDGGWRPGTSRELKLCATKVGEERLDDQRRRDGRNPRRVFGE